MGKNIIMIGMPGAGKSTIGVVLAKALCCDFVDCDLAIQGQEGCPLSRILDSEGVEGFLQVENRVLSGLEFPRQCVVATGGSAVYGTEAMAHLKENGVAVYIRLRYDSVAERLGDLHERGVALRAGQDLKAAYAERCPLYERYADVTVDADGMTIAQTLAAVQKALQAAGFAERPMRRRDRAVTSMADQLAILQKCDVCRIAMNDADAPYLVPLSFGEEESGGAVTLYFHGAAAGTKLSLLEKDARVSFEADRVEKTVTSDLACESTMYYESVVGSGRAELLSGEAAVHGLCVIMRHYGREDVTFDASLLARTQVFCIRIERMTGKRRPAMG